MSDSRTEDKGTARFHTEAIGQSAGLMSPLARVVPESKYDELLAHHEEREARFAKFVNEIEGISEAAWEDNDDCGHARHISDELSEAVLRFKPAALDAFNASASEEEK
jgi:hypothetical protein